MTWSPATGSLELTTLRKGYVCGELKPMDVIKAVYERIAARGADAVWITLAARETALEQARALEARRDEIQRLPLFGIPFAIKDNIDAAGLPTTAACPSFLYHPARNAGVVERLITAGAIVIGKTNLDQFATGLVGVRSPYGIPQNPFDPRYIPGGSSSGSAVAVAAGLVTFALGTDTAGSGRVPAGFNNIAGLKPTRGMVSTDGVVPACRSLDCVSVFALTCADAFAVFQAAAEIDPYDTRQGACTSAPPAAQPAPSRFRFGIPAAAELRTFGDAETGALFERAVERAREMGGEPVEIDFAPFRETAALLYSGPWVAERLAAVGDFLERDPGAVHPVTRGIFEGGWKFTAVDAFRAQYRLEELRRRAAAEWKKMDVLLVPTAGAAYTTAEVEAKPLELNTNLGYYTNFVNLLDGCALAVPSGFWRTGVPFGVTWIAPAFREGFLSALGSKYHRLTGGKLGATSAEVPPEKVVVSPAAAAQQTIRVAVFGAHLSGLPLNYQLTERGAKLVRACATKAVYRFYALPNTTPAKPGLVRCGAADGASIELEVWELPVEKFGGFVALIGAPLGIGTVELEDGELVKGFLCESYAVADARDISEFGGWRGYLRGAGA